MKLNVNEVFLNYKITGEGSPVILLHGNNEDSSIFDVTAELLKDSYQVYQVDSRKHGSSSFDCKLSYLEMANDIICFIEELKIKSPIIYGFSDGGIIGFYIAIKRPDLIKSLVISGVNYKVSGIKFRVLFNIFLRNLFIKNEYLTLMLKEPNIDPILISQISLETVLIVGEKDVIKKSHTIKLNNLIKGSRLIIKKGENHHSYVVNTDKLYYTLIDIFKSFN
ncbi:MAG: alpha/beta fold hydrolase [Acholeplasmatales bacterium]|jgi:pimeloyl-ACP methyl ester carboxylesterase|nr:alpha/beta fold hydrolase [Acholeplasmatales bacterium]